MFTTHERSKAAHESGPIAERIVLAIDVTGGSESALRWTVDRARRSRVAVDVVTVARVHPFRRDTVIEDDRMSAQRALDHAASVLHGVLDEHSLRTRMHRGATARGILDASSDTDLLVVGTHNATRNPVFHHPSVAARLTTAGHVDLAVIPSGWTAPVGEPLVVVGISGDAEDRFTVASAAREALRLGAPLQLVHSWDSRSAAVAAYGGLATDLAVSVDAHRELLDGAMTEASESFPGLSITGIITDAPPSRALHLASAHASLLVVGSRDTRTMDRIILGSTSHAVVTAPPCPTIVVRSRRH
jgi:nucleotide-binding universal stress UspA family protein